MPTSVEIVQAAVEAFGRGEIPAILNACTDDVAVVLYGDPSVIPFAGEWPGKSRVSDYFRVIGETTDVLRWVPQQYVASGNHVVVRGIMDARVKATGKALTNTHWAIHFTAENGKITGWQAYVDTAAVEKAFTASSSAST
jgi:uncharacterized protein